MKPVPEVASGQTVRVGSWAALKAETAKRGLLLTPFQASEAFGCSRQWIYTLLAEGRIARVSVFGVLMVGALEVSAHLSDCKVTDRTATGNDDASEETAVRFGVPLGACV